MLMATVVDLAQEDRRAARRYPCKLGISCRLMSLLGSEPFEGTVRNLSATGLNLVCRRPPRPGTFLVIQLEDRKRELARTLRAQVVHAGMESDGFWNVGCQLVPPLAPADLQAFI